MRSSIVSPSAFQSSPYSFADPGLRPVSPWLHSPARARSIQSGLPVRRYCSSHSSMILLGRRTRQPCTTNSCAAIVEDGGNVKLIPYKGGEYTIPSIFAIDDKGNELIGYEAKRQWQLNPKNTIDGSKHLVGRSFQSDVVTEMKKFVAYSVRPPPSVMSMTRARRAGRLVSS